MWGIVWALCSEATWMVSRHTIGIIVYGMFRTSNGKRDHSFKCWGRVLAPNIAVKLVRSRGAQVRCERVRGSSLLRPHHCVHDNSLLPRVLTVSAVGWEHPYDLDNRFVAGVVLGVVDVHDAVVVVAVV